MNKNDIYFLALEILKLDPKVKDNQNDARKLFLDTVDTLECNINTVGTVDSELQSRLEAQEKELEILRLQASTKGGITENERVAIVDVLQSAKGDMEPYIYDYLINHLHGEKVFTNYTKD